MFFRKNSREQKRQEKKHRKEIYDRVYLLHQKAKFLCYINDAYLEEYKNKQYMKLEGLVAKGIGKLEDSFLLFDCNGNQKAEITMEELYLGNNSVEQLEGGDKKVALYPREQNVSYVAGDVLCKFDEEECF